MANTSWNRQRKLMERERAIRRSIEIRREREVLRNLLTHCRPGDPFVRVYYQALNHLREESVTLSIAMHPAGSAL